MISILYLFKTTESIHIDSSSSSISSFIHSWHVKFLLLKYIRTFLCEICEISFNEVVAISLLFLFLSESSLIASLLIVIFCASFQFQFEKWALKEIKQGKKKWKEEKKNLNSILFAHSGAIWITSFYVSPCVWMCGLIMVCWMSFRWVGKLVEKSVKFFFQKYFLSIFF